MKRATSTVALFVCRLAAAKPAMNRSFPVLSVILPHIPVHSAAVRNSFRHNNEQWILDMRTSVSLSIVALILSTAFGAMPALAVDTSISRLCGPDAPEGYKRPGGYCDRIGANSSLGGSPEGGCTDYIVVPGPSAMLVSDEPILVAENCVFIDSAENQ
jgi:hypothetical protein